MANFAHRLKELRNERKLTQEHLANIINCSRVAITNYEQDKRLPGIETIILLANYFNVPTDYLLGRTDSPIYDNPNESLRIMILFNPVSGKILDCSQAAVSFYGYKKKKLLSMTIFDLNVDKPEKTLENINKAINGEQNIFYLSHRLADGTVKELEINTEPIYINNKTILYSIYRDVTEFQPKKPEITSIISSLMKIIGSSIEIKNPLKKDHSTRVTKIAFLIGKKMGLAKDQLFALKSASMLHDIGELYIPVEILNKTANLSTAESRIIKEHPEKGYQIIKQIGFKLPIADIILQHHERLDGTGYPKKIKEKKILTEAKILAIADVLEASISKRPYHKPKSLKTAIYSLNKDKGSKFDNLIVEVCTDLYKDKTLSSILSN